MNGVMLKSNQLVIITDISEEVEDVLLELASPKLQQEIAESRLEYERGETVELNDVVSGLNA
jgi:hypothetical protein